MYTCDIDDIGIRDYCMLMILRYALVKASPQVCTENTAQGVLRDKYNTW